MQLNVATFFEIIDGSRKGASNHQNRCLIQIVKHPKHKMSSKFKFFQIYFLLPIFQRQKYNNKNDFAL